MQFRDLKAQYRALKPQIEKAVKTVLDDCNFIMGHQVKELEEKLAEYVGVKHCITCANGTDALSLPLMAWDIKAGDAVFVPDFTFFATAEVVSLRGAAPVFVDIDADTFNIDPVKLEAAIIKTIKEGRLKPRAIIPVDLFGLPADYPEIEKIAAKYGLLILEDGAQGFGGMMNGKRACSFGHAATTSFFPAKPLGCYGDGGAIFTNDDELANIINSLKIHGKGEDKYDNVRIGLNSRLDTLQAAILMVKLDAFISHELEDVNRVYQYYNSRLKGIVEVPLIPDGFYSSFAQYTIKLKNKEQRDGLQSWLKEHGIPSMIYYKTPMHRQTAFWYLDSDDRDFEVTNKLCDTVLSLPMHPYLSEEDVERVCGAIKTFVNR
ncbi:MAG: DegT/DnrJ/EryC1/StrS family aminotransferase [Syntrophomonadaceae bacterium]|nr:DegT/DnrJ/EryC1/StrS family aminotransferase [Syntrophomonadaceae bacterium]